MSVTLKGSSEQDCITSVRWVSSSSELPPLAIKRTQHNFREKLSWNDLNFATWSGESPYFPLAVVIQILYGYEYYGLTWFLLLLGAEVKVVSHSVVFVSTQNTPRQETSCDEAKNGGMGD